MRNITQAPKKKKKHWKVGNWKGKTEAANGGKKWNDLKDHDKYFLHRLISNGIIHASEKNWKMQCQTTSEISKTCSRRYIP